MRLSWTYYPKGESQSVTLTVVYIPELDKFNLHRGGFLDYVSNVAYVDWVTYKLFDSGDLKARQFVFAGLVVLSKGGGVIIKGQHINLASAGKKEVDNPAEMVLRIGSEKP